MWDETPEGEGKEVFENNVETMYKYEFKEEDVALASIGEKQIFVLGTSGNLYEMSNKLHQLII